MTTTYNFDLVTQCGQWEVSTDTAESYGCFEHQLSGAGGGLWFEDDVLVDYDGVGSLPKQVGEALIDMGYSLGDCA